MKHLNQTELLETYLSIQRQAVDALIDLFEVKNFNDPSLAINVKVLGELCHHQNASILGNALTAAEQAKAGRWEALDVMENHIALGMGAHKTASPQRWNLGGLMHLQPVLDAIKTAAHSISVPDLAAIHPGVKRVALVVSNLSQGAATTMVARKYVLSLRALGLETYLMSTGHGLSATDERIGVEREGTHVLDMHGDTIYARAQDVVRKAAELQLDAIIYFAWPTDMASQIASCVRACPRQVFINHTCDQKVGDFDVRVVCTQDTGSMTEPHKCYYIPPVRIREETYDEIEASSPFQWGLDADAVIIGSYSRLSKCVDEAFMEAMVKVLSSNPSVVLMLPGLPDPASEALLRARFESHGLLQQVRFPGYLSDSYLPLLKATRVYCDTFGWTGGQSVLDALAMGVPVVAVKTDGRGSALDPSGVSPATLASAYLPDATLIADPGDVDGYVRIVQQLLGDPAHHQSHSLRNRERSREFTWQQFPRILVNLLEQIPRSSQSASIS